MTATLGFCGQIEYVPITCFDRNLVESSPWKNGGGRTRQIVCRPEGAGLDSFDWRVSIASVNAGGPFSVFTGIDRVIMLLDGVGMRLRSPDGEVDRVLDLAVEPFAFDGEAEISCDLVAGGIDDFNVMTRRATTRAQVRVIRNAEDLRASSAGLLFAARGAWTVSAGAIRQALASDTGLWWEDLPSSWRALPERPDTALIAVSVDRRSDDSV